MNHSIKGQAPAVFYAAGVCVFLLSWQELFHMARIILHIKYGRGKVEDMRKILLFCLLALLYAMPAQAMVVMERQEGPSWKMDYPLVYVDDPGAQAAINSDINRYLDAFQEAMATNNLIREGIIKTKLCYEDENVISLTLVDYHYTGGAHGMYVVYGLVYDVHTGARIPLENYVRLTTEDVAAELPDNTFTYDTTTPVRKFMNEPKRVPSDYYLTGDGSVNIIFQPYEIAAYAAGAPYLHLTAARMAYYNEKNK